jgi:hypothetical protein
MCCNDWGHETMIIYPEKVVCECYVWMEGVANLDRLISWLSMRFLGRRIEELGIGSFIEVVVLDIY